MEINKANKLFLLAVLLIIGNEIALGQRWKLRRYEIGGGVGFTQVFGDIGGSIDESNWFGLKDIKLDETRLAFPIHARYKISPLYTAKINLVLGFGNGTDADSRNDRGRSYKTKLFEFSAQGEYYIITEEKRFKSAAMFSRRGMVNNYSTFGLYGFLGIGGVFSSAKVDFTQDPAQYDDIKEKSLGFVIPFGLGVKYIIDDRWLVNAELGYRFSMSDYIEGYTQLEDSKHNDVYYFLMFTLSYKLETSRRGWPSFMDRQYKKASYGGRGSSNKAKPKTRRGALR